MSVLKKIISWILFSVLVFILLWITYIIYCWSNCSCIGHNTIKTLPNNKGSKVAVLKPDTPRMPKIRIERYLTEEPYKFPFYSPQSYTDYFFIDFRFTDSITFVIDNSDTVRWGDLYVIDTVPSRIRGYDDSGALLVTYYQDTLFQSNIEHKSTVSVLEQISWGPTKSDCSEQCD